jgi:hypothetical protein
MKEDQWNRCTDPKAMLEFLRSSGRASERKLRLFAVACCHGVWNWMTDRRSRQGVKVAERYADGLASGEDLADAREGTAGAWTTVWGDGWHIYQSARAAHFACGEGEAELLLVADEVRNAVRNAASTVADGWVVQEAERLRQAALLRDLFGPFMFRPITIEESWLRWNEGCVVKIASAIYEERRFADLPILADALEDAGCSDAEILGHLRGPGPHARGCWALDLLLKKA